jgi:hypothetical protein
MVKRKTIGQSAAKLLGDKKKVQRLEIVLFVKTKKKSPRVPGIPTGMKI